MQPTFAADSPSASICFGQSTLLAGVRLLVSCRMNCDMRIAIETKGRDGAAVRCSRWKLVEGGGWFRDVAAFRCVYGDEVGSRCR